MALFLKIVAFYHPASRGAASWGCPLPCLLPWRYPFCSRHLRSRSVQDLIPNRVFLLDSNMEIVRTTFTTSQIVNSKGPVRALRIYILKLLLVFFISFSTCY